MRQVIIGTHPDSGRRIVVGPVISPATIAALCDLMKLEGYVGVGTIDYYSAREFRTGAHRPLPTATEEDEDQDQDQDLEVHERQDAPTRAEEVPATPTAVDDEPDTTPASASEDRHDVVNEQQPETEDDARAEDLQERFADGHDDSMYQRPALQVVPAEQVPRDVVAGRIGVGAEAKPAFVDADAPVDPVAFLARELAAADQVAGGNELMQFEDLAAFDRHHYVRMARLMIRRGVVPLNLPATESAADDVEADGPLEVAADECITVTTVVPDAAPPWIDLTIAGSTVAALTPAQARELASELILHARGLEAQGAGQ